MRFKILHREVLLMTSGWLKVKILISMNTIIHHIGANSFDIH